MPKTTTRHTIYGSMGSVPDVSLLKKIDQMESIQDDVKKPSKEDGSTLKRGVINVTQEVIACIFSGPESRNITNKWKLQGSFLLILEQVHGRQKAGEQ